MTVSTYFQPTSVPEALALLGEHGPDLLVIAGGTIAMQGINDGTSLPRLVMGLRRAGIDGGRNRRSGRKGRNAHRVARRSNKRWAYGNFDLCGRSRA